jgi:hypothetical protein
MTAVYFESKCKFQNQDFFLILYTQQIWSALEIEFWLVF